VETICQKRSIWKKTNDERNPHKELESRVNKNRALEAMKEWSW
jgi:hypothetical protein